MDPATGAIRTYRLPALFGSGVFLTLPLAMVVTQDRLFILAAGNIGQLKTSDPGTLVGGSSVPVHEVSARAFHWQPALQMSGAQKLQYGNDGQVWAAAATGLASLKLQNGVMQLSHYPAEVGSVNRNFLVPDGRGRLWLAYLGGLLRFDPHTHEWKQFPLPLNTRRLPGPPWYTQLPAPFNRLGLRAQRSVDFIFPFQRPGWYNNTISPGTTSGIPRSVSGITVALQGTIWFSSDNEIGQLHLSPA